MDGLLNNFEAIGDGRLTGASVDPISMRYHKVLYQKHIVFYKLSDG